MLDVLAPRAGQRLGAYELHEELGAGAMGRVYRATERDSGAERAIKALRPGAAASELYSLKREFRTGAPLSHPNLIPIYDLVVEQGSGYLVMPLLRGRTLERWAAEHPWRDAPERLLQIIADAARGVGALHRGGVVHRDIKPSNIMVEPDHHVFVMDYGLATLDANSERFVTSSPAQLAGTAAYMPPEAMLGAPPRDVRDVFALGVALFEVVTGALPSRDLHDWSVDMDATLERWQRDWPGDPSTAALLIRCLAPDPDARPKMEEFAERLVRGRPDDDATGSPEGSLVGRGHESKLLMERLTLAGDVTLLSGPSGSGKTSLAVDGMARLRDASEVKLVLQGRCHPGEHLRYRGLDAVLDELTNWLRRCGPETQERVLPRELPVLQEAFGAMRRLVPPPSRVEFRAARAPEERRRQLIEGLAELLQRCHATWPTAVWIDDIQWSDLDGAHVLRDVISRLGGDGPTFLLSGRKLPAGLDVHHFEVPLDPLDERSSRALVQRALHARGRRVHDDVIDSLIEEAHGNPGLLVFVTAHLSDEERAAPTLTAAIGHRLEAMTEAERETLLLTALHGEPLPIQALAECAPGDTRAILHRLEGVGLARRVPTPSGDAVEIPHAHLRSAIEAGSAAASRPALHRRLAIHLEPLSTVPRGAVADHWERAGDLEEAARLLRSAGQQSLEHLAFDHAAACYERALTLSSETDADTRAALARAYALGGRSAAAAEAFLAAAAGRPSETHLRLSASQQCILAGDVDRGVDIARDLFASAGHRIPGAFRVLASLFWDRLTQRFRRHAYRLTPAHSTDAHVADTAFAICTTLALAEPVLASYLQRTHLRASLRSGDPVRIARALALESGFHGFAHGGRERGRALAEEARSVMGAREDPRLDALLAISEAGAAWSTGRWGECVGAATIAERIARESCVGAWWERSFARSTLQDSLRWMGRYDELAALTSLFMQDAEERQNRFAAFTYRTRFVTVVELVADRPEAAWRACAEGPQWGSRSTHLQHLAAMHAQAECLLYLGQPTQALQLVQARRRSMRWSPLMRAPGPRAKAAHLLASCHLAVAATGVRPRFHRWRARRAARQIERADCAHTDLLATTVRQTAALMAGERGADRALERCAEEADLLSMPQYRAAITLALGLRAGDSGSVQRAERALRQLGVRAARRWAATLVPGLLPATPSQIELRQSSLERIGAGR